MVQRARYEIKLVDLKLKVLAYLAARVGTQVCVAEFSAKEDFWGDYVPHAVLSLLNGEGEVKYDGDVVTLSGKPAWQHGLVVSSPEYLCAQETHSVAQRIFAAAQIAYRLRKLSDAQFLEARADFMRATTEYDVAFMNEQARLAKLEG